MIMKRKLSLPLALLLAALLFAQRGSESSLASTSESYVAPKQLQVYVLNVERGQSVLVVPPSGKAALIDAGPQNSGGLVVSELRRLGVRNLELVVATQAGADYIGGLRRVVQSSDIVVKNLIDSAQPWKTDAHEQLLSAAQSANIPVTGARRGLFFDLGGGARIDILNPAGDGTWLEPQSAGSRENANSVIVRVLYREFVMLVMGGASAATAEQVIEARQNVWAPFLVVGNGGASGAVSEKMLSFVKPRFAFISSAANLAPAPDTLEQLKSVKSEVYRTDTSGTITVTSDGKTHEVQVSKK
jgi:competence protein ComEC